MPYNSLIALLSYGGIILVTSFIVIIIGSLPTSGQSNYQQDSRAISDLPTSLVYYVKKSNNINPISSVPIQSHAVNSDKLQCLQQSEKADLLEITAINASGFVQTDRPENVNDSDLSTIWISYSDDSWIELDLGCENIISTVDIAWHNSDKIRYGFTFQVYSDSNKTVPAQELTSLTDIVSPDAAYQSIGTNNSQGRYIKISSNTQYDRALHPDNFSISEIKVHGYNLQNSPKTSSSLDKLNLNTLWQNLSFPYPQTITILNSNGDIVEIPLTAISDGDEDSLCNPYYQIPEVPVIALSLGKPFSVSINESHVEGISINTKFDTCAEDNIGITDIGNKTAKSGRLIFGPLNETDTIYEGNTTKNFLFVPQIDTEEYFGKSVNNLAVSVATSDETSIDFITRVLFHID
jgi:hypothetical protein